MRNIVFIFHQISKNVNWGYIEGQRRPKSCEFSVWLKSKNFILFHDIEVIKVPVLILLFFQNTTMWKPLWVIIFLFVLAAAKSKRKKRKFTPTILV